MRNLLKEKPGNKLLAAVFANDANVFWCKLLDERSHLIFKGVKSGRYCFLDPLNLKEIELTEKELFEKLDKYR